MKLNKPEVTESQTVLEDYVVSLLIDPSEKLQQNSQAQLTAVAKTNDSQDKLPQVEAITDENVALKQVVSDVIPLKQKNLSHKTSKQNKSEPSLKENVSKTTPHLAKIINVQNNSKLQSEEIQRKITNEPEVDDEKMFESKSIPINERFNKKQSKELQQKHTEKINQEIEAYEDQASHQKNFKENNEKDPRLQGVEKLLAKIALANVIVPKETDHDSKTTIQAKSTVEIMPDDLSDADLASSQASFSHREKQPLKDILGSVFQTLVFEVGKLPLAVPLIKLGGIVNVSEQDITPLVGTPDWFMGLVPHEKGNLMVVDTQRFLMPEQNTDQQQAYRYLIILDDSLWALACHSVGDAKNLSPEDIRWSSGSSKRPWFAGMVVEYMSALIEVDRLINMLTENIVD